MILRLFLGLTLLCCSCSLSNRQIEQKEWKFSSGCYIGDWLSFSENDIRNDTIFRDSIPTAIILETQKRVFDDVLVLKSLDGKCESTYCSK